MTVTFNMRKALTIACTRKNISKSDLARKMQVNIKTLHSWQDSQPTMRTICKLCNYLNIAPHKFIKEGEEYE